MAFSWQGRVVLVTGGSAGLGLSLARAWGRRGARVLIAARDSARIAAALTELTSEGLDARGWPADVTRQSDVDSLVHRLQVEYGRLDVLVNAVGRSTRGEALQVTPDEFRELMDVNFLTAVRCCRAFAPLLKATAAATSTGKQPESWIVNIGSLASKSAAKYLGGYPPSKFALAGYSQQLRYELREHGIHVMLVCPGPIKRTDGGRRYDSLAANLPDAARQPGGGVQLTGLEPDYIAGKVIRGCEKRHPELVLPGKARLLFALAQLFPRLGDWIVGKKTAR